MSIVIMRLKHWDGVFIVIMRLKHWDGVSIVISGKQRRHLRIFTAQIITGSVALCFMLLL